MSDTASNSKPSRESSSRTLRLARKELREILRDRRTVLTLVLMPLLVYPLLGVIMRKGVLSNLSLLQAVEIHVCLESKEQASMFAAAMVRAEALIDPDGGGAADEPGPATENSTTLKLSGEQPSEFVVYWLDESNPNLTLSQQLKENQADIAVLISPSVEVPQMPNGVVAGRFLDWKILRRDSSALSERGYREIKKRLDAFNEDWTKTLLKSAGLPRQLPISTTSEIVQADGDGVSPLVTFIPLVLVLMTMTGAVYPAIDLTAGERERGTMEILVAAPVSRMTLLAGKFVAVLTVALLTASMNLISMFATLFALGLEGTVLGNVSLTMIVQVVVLMVVFAAFFSAVLLSITSVARSFKEAQAYLIPLMLISLTPGVFSLMPNLKINSFLAVTPLVNTVLMGRDLLQGDVNILMFAIVLISTALYGVLALSLAARIFGSDSVLYSSGGSWAELFRRPEEESSVAPIPISMSTLAVVFSLFIVVGAIPSRLDLQLFTTLGLTKLAGQLLAAGLVSVLLFVVVPLIAAAIGRVRVSSGFALRGTGWTMWTAALLLGGSLWAFVYEIEVSMLTASRIEELTRLYESFELNLSSVPLWIKLFALAVAPAACEEFFFRGFLQNSIRQKTSAAIAILTAGILFGLFHVIVKDALLFERLIPSALMGMMLGFVFEKSGSVFPGMLLHVVHNGFLVTVSEYEEQLTDLGIGVSNHQHLPVGLILGAAVPVMAAVLMLTFSRRSGKLAAD